MTAFRVNPETQFVESSGKLTADGFNALQQIADAAEAEDGGTAGAGIVDCWAGLIEIVADKSYLLVVNVPFAGTISETTTDAETGTATFTFDINGTPLGGTANDVSTVEQSQNHASANTFIAGDNIGLTASSNSSCEGASFTIKYTRS